VLDCFRREAAARGGMSSLISADCFISWSHLDLCTESSNQRLLD